MNAAASQSAPPYRYEYPHPAVTTDVAVFTIRDRQLQLLLIRRARDPFGGFWALPGGFLEMDEDLEQCAARELKEETGVAAACLEQLRTFGRPGRDPRERVISVVFFALIPSGTTDVKAASDAADAAWFPVGDLPPLAFDHAEIVEAARERLRLTPSCSDIAFQLLPDAFTLRELQDAYEVLTGEEIDTRGFRRWALASERIEETGELRRRGRHSPVRVYRLRSRKRVDFTR